MTKPLGKSASIGALGPFSLDRKGRSDYEEAVRARASQSRAALGAEGTIPLTSVRVDTERSDVPAPALGAEVTLHSLRSRATFNGSHGHVVRHCKDGIHIEVSLSEQNEKLRVKPENLSLVAVAHGVAPLASPKWQDQNVDGAGSARNWTPSSSSSPWGSPAARTSPISGTGKADVSALAAACVSELQQTVSKVQKAWMAALGAREQLRELLQPQQGCQQQQCLEGMERIDVAVRGMSGWAQDLDVGRLVDASPSASSSGGQGPDAGVVPGGVLPGMRRSSSSTRLRAEVARASQDLSASFASSSSTTKVAKHPTLRELSRCLAATSSIADDQVPLQTGVPETGSTEMGVPNMGSADEGNPEDERPERKEIAELVAVVGEDCSRGPSEEGAPEEERPKKEHVAAYVKALGEAVIATAVENELARNFDNIDEGADVEATPTSRPQESMVGATGETGGTHDALTLQRDSAPEHVGDDIKCLAGLAARADNLALDYHAHRMTVPGQAFEGMMHFTNLKMLALDFDHCGQLSCVEDIGKSFTSLLNLQELVMQFRHCAELTNVDGFSRGLEALTKLKILRADFSHCARLTSVGELGRSLAFLTSLSSLSLSLRNCQLLQDVSAVGNSLQYLVELRTLVMDLSDCAHLSGADELGKGLTHLSDLRSCKLNLSSCGKLKNVDEIGRALPYCMLTTFSLDLRDCGQLTSVEELKSGLKGLPALQTITLDLQECESLAACEQSRISTLQELKDFVAQEQQDSPKKKGKAIVLEESIDETYEPTQEEIEEYAAWLGMDLLKDRDLFWIASAALKEPVPKPWKPCRMEGTDDIFYFNFDTGESIWDHPCDLRFKQVYEEQIQKRQDDTRYLSWCSKGQADADVGRGELEEALASTSSPREGVFREAALQQAIEENFMPPLAQAETNPSEVEGSPEAAPKAPRPRSAAGSRARKFNVSFPSRC